MAVNMWISTCGSKANQMWVPGTELVRTLLSTREPGLGRTPGRRLSEGPKLRSLKQTKLQAIVSCISKVTGKKAVPGAGGGVGGAFLVHGTRRQRAMAEVKGGVGWPV